MIFWIKPCVFFIVTVSTSQAQLLPVFYPEGSRESAISINDAPIGIYGKTVNPFGVLEEHAASLSGAPVSVYGKQESNGYPYRIQDEYAASLSDAPISVYGKQNSLFQNFYYPPFYLDYWSYLYFSNYLEYDYSEATISPPENVYPESNSQPQISYPEDEDPETKLHEIQPRSVRGSLSVASSKADARKERTKADAASVQGIISDDILRDFISF